MNSTNFEGCSQLYTELYKMDWVINVQLMDEINNWLDVTVWCCDSGLQI